MRPSRTKGILDGVVVLVNLAKSFSSDSGSSGSQIIKQRWTHSSMKPMITKTFFFLLLFAALPTFLIQTAFAGNQSNLSRPNIIFVLADDLGIGDTQPTNASCKIQTPNLVRLAKSGITFTDAHSSSSVCTPTRYGLLTGRYNWRSRLARGVLSGTSDHLIPNDRATVAHLLKKVGYHTQMIGKWHLGWDWTYKQTEAGKGKEIDFEKPVMNGPDINGFDGYYAHCGSLDMPPYVWVDTGRATAIPTHEEGVTKQQDPYGWYRKGPISPDFKIDEVLPHLFGKAIKHVILRSDKQHSAQPFFLYLALPAPHTPIVPVAPFKDASGINPYADFVMQVDHHMGQLIDALEQQGIAENTLVVFSSDNGCSPEANFGVLKSHGHHPSEGFRGHKADIYEGGHRVPLIASWPNVIAPAQSTTQLACLTDFYSTVASITKIDHASGGEDSHSWLPIFTGQGNYTRQSLVSHSIGGSFAIREGDWKLCLSAGSGGWSSPKEADAVKQNLPPIQLFDLSTDPRESENLQSKHPETVNRLIQLLKTQVEKGRSTEGPQLSNDRQIEFLPKSLR